MPPEARLNDPEAYADVSELLHYVTAVKHGLSRLAELPVSVRLIREIRPVLMDGLRGSRPAPGELRSTQNWIGSGGCTLQDAVCVPPLSHEAPEALSALERFLHSDSRLPVLVQVAVVHAQFETIHPLLDGNGRIGRLLIAFLLVERRLQSRPVLYLFYFFKRHRVIVSLAMELRENWIDGARYLNLEDRRAHKKEQMRGAATESSTLTSGNTHGQLAHRKFAELDKHNGVLRAGSETSIGLWRLPVNEGQK